MFAKDSFKIKQDTIDEESCLIKKDLNHIKRSALADR